MARTGGGAITNIAAFGRDPQVPTSGRRAARAAFAKLHADGHAAANIPLNNVPHEVIDSLLETEDRRAHDLRSRQF